MRESLVNKLRCPVDMKPFRLNSVNKDSDGRVMEGELISEEGNVYPIVDGVPNLIPDAEIKVGDKDLGKL